MKSAPLCLVSLIAILLFQSRASAELITHSVADFSGTQGQGGWFYGFYDQSFDSDNLYASTDFQLMTQYNAADAAWHVQNGTYWTSVFANGAHPNGAVTNGGRVPVNHFAIRRWVSNFDGEITISGNLAKLNTAGGNGIIGSVIVGGSDQIYSQFVDGTDGIGFSYSVNTTVANGTIVDFIVNPLLVDGSDGSLFTATITSVPEPSSILLLLSCFGTFGLYRNRRKSSLGPPNREHMGC